MSDIFMMTNELFLTVASQKKKIPCYKNDWENCKHILAIKISYYWSDRGFKGYRCKYRMVLFYEGLIKLMPTVHLTLWKDTRNSNYKAVKLIISFENKI